jgi:ABC-2 type transport system permease protein
MKLARDTWLIYQRSLLQVLRNPVWLIFGLLQPILYLVCFGPLLHAVASAPGFPGGGSWNVFVPGLLLQIAVFGGGFVGFGLIAQLRYGVVERFRVTPMNRTAMLLGMALRDATVLVSQGLLLLAVAIPFGLTLDAADVAVAVAGLLLVGVTLSPISYAVALKMRSEDAFAPFVNGVALPLLLLSGVLLPMSLAPDWLRAVAQFDPFLHVVDALRAVFTATGDPSTVVFGLGLFAVLGVLALWVGRLAFSRAVA